MNPAYQNLPSAGVGKRLAALLYDSLLLMALAIAYGALVLAIKIRLLGITLAPGEKADMGLLGFMGLLFVLVGFYIFFWRRFGQTLGMKAWRLVLTDATGEKPTQSRCLLRCVLACVSLAFGGMGYFWRWLDKDQLTIHDRLSGTRVWQLPKKP